MGYAVSSRPLLLNTSTTFLTTSRIPKLNETAAVKAYIEVRGAVATVDSRRLLDFGTREAGSFVRSVEDPVLAREKVEKVCPQGRVSHSP